MLHNKDIAIISPVTLINIGLKQIMTDYFSAGSITLYGDAGCFLSESPEKYDLYFTFPDTFLFHYDFFLPRKGKTILLTDCTYPQSDFSNIEHQLSIRADLNSLIEQLQSLIENTCQKFPNDSQEELSPREIEVLQLIAQGYINKEIADRLNISINTVLSHRKNITAKLGIKSVSGLSFYAMMNGYVSSVEIE
ncbi:response regulator transcription factor [Coprobacter sp.]